MLIRADDESIYNLAHIERLEIAEVALEEPVAEEGDTEGTANDEETAPSTDAYVLLAYIAGEGHVLIGPTEDRDEAAAGLHRIFNMVSERADLHRPSNRTRD